MSKKVFACFIALIMVIPLFDGFMYANAHGEIVVSEEGGSVDISDLLWVAEEDMPEIEIWGETVWADPVEEDFIAFDMMWDSENYIHISEFTDAAWDNLSEEDMWGETVWADYTEYEEFTPFGIDFDLEDAVSFLDMELVTDEDWLEDELWGEIIWADYTDVEEFMAFDAEFDFENSINFWDMELVTDEEWLEDDDIFPVATAVVSVPALTISRGTLLSTSVTLNGTITNAGGATLLEHGFLIRRVGDTNDRREIMLGGATTFSRTITGLEPGTTYIARAVARNSGVARFGESTAIQFTTPAVAPGAPRNLGVMPGNGQAILSWIAPLSNGGAAITRYEVSSNNGITWVTASSSTGHTFTGLSSGSHTFRVRAINSAGIGTWSPPATVNIANITLPTLSISRGSTGSHTVALTGSINNTGGATILEHGFLIRRAIDTVDSRIIILGGATTFNRTIVDLEPGTAYIASAIARNSGVAGFGRSAEISFTTSATAPGAPRNFGVTPGNGQAMLSWTAPLSNGGSAITRYEVSRDNGSTWVTAASHTGHTFTGLPSGTHTFRVRAINSAGIGSWSPPATVNIIAGNVPTLSISHSNIMHNEVELTGMVINNGGTAITSFGFEIRRAVDSNFLPHPLTGTATTFSRTITGLQPNTAYVVRAFAVNSAGRGVSSQITFTTLAHASTVPGVPQNFSATPGGGLVSLNWDAPINDGGSLIIGYEVSINNGAWTSMPTTVGLAALDDVGIAPLSAAFGHIALGLPGGIVQTFRIRAVNAVGAGAPTNGITVTPLTLPTLEITRGTMTPTTVHLAASMPDIGNATMVSRGFWIRRVADVGMGWQPVNVSGTGSAFSQTITGLQPGTAYMVRAFATLSTGGIQASVEIRFTTPMPNTVPSVPRNLIAIPGNGNVILSWEAPESNGSSRLLEYQISMNNGATWVTTAPHSQAAPIPGYIFLNLPNQIVQTFRVRAVNAQGASDWVNITTVPHPTAINWTWPVYGVYRRMDQGGIRSYFRHPRRPNHVGIDIDSRVRYVEGDPILAFAAGEVMLAGSVDSYGYVIYINTPNLNGFEWIQHRYAHLEENSFDLVVGDRVIMGSHIANMGNTDHGNPPTSTREHLHFETRMNATAGTAPTTRSVTSTPIDPIANFFTHIPFIMREWSWTGRATGFVYGEDEISCSIYEMFVDVPNGRLPWTVGNLIHFSMEEVWAMNISMEYFQGVVDDWGLDAVLRELNGLGLEHLGFTIGQDGKLERITRFIVPLEDWITR